MPTQRPVLGLKTWVDGELVTAGDLNQQGREHIDFLTNRRPHGTIENHTETNTIENNKWTTIQFDTIKRDTTSGFSSNGEFVSQISGWYYVSAGLVFVNNGNGARGIRWVVNGFPHISGAVLIKPDANVAAGVAMSRMIPLVEGQVLAIQGWQDSGGSLDLNKVEPELSYFDIFFFSQFFGYNV